MTTVGEGEVHVGRYYGEHEITVTPEEVKEYCDTVGDRNPWYTGPSPFGGPVAPALIRHSEVYRYGGWYLKNMFGNLHAKQEWELFHPIMVGDHITSRSLIVDRYIKRGRDYVVNEVTYFGQDGRLLLRGRTHQGFLLEDAPQQAVVDKDSMKKAGRKFEMGPGDVLEEVPSLSKVVTREMSRRFSGPSINYHTDVEEAHRMGFPDMVIQGMLSVCFLSEMMTSRFGEGWFRGGRMSVNLVNVLWPEERLICRGAVKELTLEGSHQRAHLEVWCEKEEGTATIAGRASAVVL